MLKTEMRNPRTTHIDSMTTEQMLEVMQDENRVVTESVGAVLKDVAKAVDGIFRGMQAGGRLFYIGCGTSGRIAVADAAECPPTYGVSPDRVVGIIAGGDSALRTAVEGYEDSFEAGYQVMEPYRLSDRDSVIGLSAAGGAAFVLGALTAARERGALTVAITSNAGAPLTELADIAVCPDTGAEVVTGSTRMKAGTSQKIILNMISTSVMIKLGYVYENFMINLCPSNVKLRSRMIYITSQIAGISLEEAERHLKANGFDIRAAVKEASAV